MKSKKNVSLLIDIAMYAVMLAQMLYVITGNAVHEWLGIGFFVLLVCHMILKRRQVSAPFFCNIYCYFLRNML